jgi:hypothetical protein
VNGSLFIFDNITYCGSTLIKYSLYGFSGILDEIFYVEDGNTPSITVTMFLASYFWPFIGFLCK